MNLEPNYFNGQMSGALQCKKNKLRFMAMGILQETLYTGAP